MRNSKYRSPIAAAMHETVKGMYRASVVDNKTMRQFDVHCLTSREDLSADDIVAMREHAGVSQAVFARALNVTTGSVINFECGTKRPTGSTLKLLWLVQRKGFKVIV